MSQRRTFIKYSVLSLGTLPLAKVSAGKILTRQDPHSYSAYDEEGMKRLGLIGGTSWHSTVDYYRYINQIINDRKGDRVNPPLLLINLSQKKINDLQAKDGWNEIAEIYISASHDLIKAGAKGIVFCSNTAHAVYSEVSRQVSVPILHIADATAIEARKKGLKTLGLLGTKYTMDKNYIKNRFAEKYGISVVVPAPSSRVELGRIIREELSNGELKKDSKEYVVGEMDKLKNEGAQGMVLGCTEFPMLVKQEDYNLPVFDTTWLHSKMAADFILGE